MKTNIIIMGDEVGFTLANGEELTLPDDIVIVRDVEGDILPKNEVFFLPCVGRATGVTVGERAHDAAARWYGSEGGLERYAVDLPTEKPAQWKSRGAVSQIRYRRLGHLADQYQHPFNPFVQLLHTAVGGTSAWRFVLPEDFVIDERGFVFP